MDYRIMRIDPRSVTPEAVTFADDTLTINLPQHSYNSGCPYFLRLIEDIPAETTIGALVVITIGTGAVEYPLLDCQGVQVTAERLRSGYSYPVTVVGTNANGAFKVIAPMVFRKYNAAVSLDGTDPAAAEGGAAG
jgi:hypothetical protein